MKLVSVTEDIMKHLSTLSHHALKGAGVEAFAAVKAVEAWLATAAGPSVPQSTQDK